MSTRRNIIGLIVCFSVAVLAGQTRSQVSRTRQRVRQPDAERLRYMSFEERKRASDELSAAQHRRFEERMAKQRMESEQRAKDWHDGKDERRNQFLKEILEVTEEQWKVIEPKINKIYFFRNQSSITMGCVVIAVGYSGGGVGYGAGSSSSSGGYRTGGSSGGGSSGYVMVGVGRSDSSSGGSALFWEPFWSGPAWRLADRPWTEGEKACEELYELLGDKNSDPEKIGQKMVALRRAREEAGEQLDKVRQELREMLNPRQEANLVLLGVLD